ncbi:YciI family protein [Saccharothrix sp. NPDC042600]|uniref:YciI family protein n=1 Tax=Saccharothrix TaxID=2071 RepID=UPI0033FB1712|nr:YciI family protein [Saccharothrix mutabilis subsp. capreolus]
MKYLLLIQTNPANRAVLPRSEQDAVMAEYFALTREIVESGEYVSGEPLADVNGTRTVRVRDGRVEVTDGPFAESKEVLAGYYVVDVESEERAIELAQRIPDARYNAVEVRACMDLGGLES